MLATSLAAQVGTTDVRIKILGDPLSAAVSESATDPVDVRALLVQWSDVSGHVTHEQSPVSAAEASFWSAPAGARDGEYRLGLDGAVTIPGGTLVGVYASTVTVAINGTAP